MGVPEGYEVQRDEIPAGMATNYEDGKAYEKGTKDVDTSKKTKFGDLPFYYRYNPLYWVVYSSSFFVAWMTMLSGKATFGLLFSIFAVQHIQKGLAQSYLTNSVSFYFRDRGGISASQMQIYISVIMTPWSLKGLMGIGSDVLAIGGYHKIPYMLFTAVAAILCLAAVGTTPESQISLGVALMCLFMAQMHIALNDLLIEAKYSEKIQQNPSINSDLVSYVWGGMSVMSLVAVGTVGLVIERLGARWVFALCILPIFLGCFPVAFNAMDDKPVAGRKCCHFDSSVLRRRGQDYMYLAVLMTVLGLGLANSGVFNKNIKFNLVLAIMCGLITIAGFFKYTPPMIAKVNAFTLIQTLFSMSIEGATFYFFTDGPEQYPEGPHFSDWFYTTAIGLVASGTAILGIFLFNAYLGNMKYRTIFLWSSLVYSSLSLLNIIVYLRLNRKWGIPDKMFVLGSAALQTVIKEFNYMPAVMIMSRLCPKGLEATMFALLASASNLGSNISNYSGAFLLDVMGVRPTGANNESHQFKNLWLVALITAILPCLPLVLLPYLIPDARPNDEINLPGVDVEDDNIESKRRRYGVERDDAEEAKGFLTPSDDVPAGARSRSPTSTPGGVEEEI
mmetsp:Transcript_11002/g.27002  ORF Transcript_11002/g.27002 Transcript_11002/m.27002 type:complete len:618 (-) Transcript_11002:239-2092(-)|eukprot:CAMPEP_0114507312 /NCGR_PEP_ID=MMETSP0109-20121206/11939_1 /TAXON_ID=29199 /ORGANISM="Chlorarachnion reptans, Strain CCCM449" /LENGTH=617 /DNA_ID=CAMNT_0001686049 /DNA_START=203 /DNA_END=2056 /DNA_ORIENTATION=+